jgi:hypothetical protein
MVKMPTRNETTRHHDIFRESGCRNDKRTVGSPASWLVSRIDELDHYQTVLYEIDMLRFAHERIPPLWDQAREGDVWVYLECFLLHYRNLIEFFGKEPSYESDLTIQKPKVIWPMPDTGPSENDLRAIRATGERLWKKYESGKMNDTISRYLQYSTTFRIAFCV